MADISFQNAWETTTVFPTFTALNSLADGNIWQSGQITDTSPTRQVLQISYNLVTNALMTANEFISFWVVGGDGDATTPYWPGSIGTTQGAITTAANIAASLAARGNPHHQHNWQTSHGTTFRGHFLVFTYRPNWQLLIRPFGEALAATGNVARYRYVDAQTVGL